MAQSEQTSAADPSPSSKGMFYHSAWSPPVLSWRLAGDAAFDVVTMADAGTGRSPTERRWRVAGLPAAGREIEFYFTNGAGVGRDPGSGVYRTALDALFVQDGELFTYSPPPSVGLPQQINVGNFFSAVLGENRPYRVLLPRGYAQNPNRRYPVLYMHDGQNVFDTGPFGTWDADTTAFNMIRRGELREVIIVGVENTANRARDYIPPDDIVPTGPGTGQPGRANLYAQFLITELKPAIYATYRTLPDRERTGTIGSSLGAVAALYLGWDQTVTFGRCGAMSGSWQLPNFPNRVRSQPYRDLRICLDSGDSGPSSDNAWPTMSLRDGLLPKGYVLEGNLRHVVGYGQQHTEAVWANRLPKGVNLSFPCHRGAA